MIIFALSKGLPVAAAMPMLPSGAGETQRATRRSGHILQADRIILPQTRQRRDDLLVAFDVWLAENLRTTFDRLVCGPDLNFEEVTEALVAYGKDMYQAGKSYGRYSETINAVTSKRPALRRNIAAAWDLAFNRVVDESHEHHAAMPLSLMLATVSLGMLWGWIRESALVALAWTGVLRIGEVLVARRSDLILPEDSAPGVESVILKIRMPKTRGRAARHQSTRIDPVDVVCLLCIAFSNIPQGDLLWPLSPATFRRRFALLQSALGLVQGPHNDQIYSLSSLRPGGATYWLQRAEDAEFVRRKGRWLSSRVLEIYLQEASVATFNARLSSVTKSRIEALCQQFPRILEKAKFFKQTNIPETIWPQLW